MAKIFKTVYKCRECGSTCYLPVIGRAEDGSLRATGQYKCSGCRNVFTSIRAWREPCQPELTVHSRFA